MKKIWSDDIWEVKSLGPRLTILGLIKLQQQLKRGEL